MFSLSRLFFCDVLVVCNEKVVVAVISGFLEMDKLNGLIIIGLGTTTTGHNKVKCQNPFGVFNSNRENNTTAKDK